MPKNGQAGVLQGELLREIEKLRCEVQDNGNINWDRDFSYFCDFIKETLCNQSIYSRLDKAKFELILSYIQDCGSYAMRWNNGNILDDELDIEKIAYTKDNLYDIIADAIGMLQAKNNTPIPYKKQ